MALNRELVYEFTGGVRPVKPLADGSSFYVGTSQDLTHEGVRVLDYPTPSGDAAITGTTALEDPEYITYAADGGGSYGAGTLWAVDRVNYTATVFGVTGAAGALVEVDPGGSGFSIFAYVRHASWAAMQRPLNGDWWVTDFTHEVQVFDSTGAEVGVIDLSSGGDLPGLGGGAWVGDVLYLADNDFGRVYAVQPDGSFVHSGDLSYLGEFLGLEDLAYLGGRLYVTSRGFFGPSGVFSVTTDLDDLRGDYIVTPGATDEAPIGLSNIAGTLYACSIGGDGGYLWRFDGGRPRWWAGVAGSG